MKKKRPSPSRVALDATFPRLACLQETWFKACSNRGLGTMDLFLKKNSALTFSLVFILFYSTWYGLPLNLQF